MLLYTVLILILIFFSGNTVRLLLNEIRYSQECGSLPALRKNIRWIMSDVY